MYRQRLALMTYYYPHLDLNDMTDDDFAFWSENAYWVHSQMLMVQQANTVGMLTGGAK